MRTSSMRKTLLVVAVIAVAAGSRARAQRLDCPPQDRILPCRCTMRGDDFQVWCSHSELPRVLEGLKSLGQHVHYPIDELILENNNLPSLPGRAFQPLKVMRLMLRNNGLERMSADWLSGLETSLMELFIVEPVLRSFPEDTLHLMTSLEAITIQTELTKRLPNFSGLPRLRYLQVESTSLQELSPRHFKMLPALEKFHLTGSPRLLRLESGTLHDLPRLNFINISYCGISTIHPRTFSRLPALTELVLTNNRIIDAAMVGQVVRDIPSLEILRLDYNKIEKLEGASFVGLPRLKNLYLSNNHIVEIQHGAFHRVPMLRTLDLNNNLIRRIHPESFFQNSASGLEELSIVNNDITHISELRSLLDALPRLTYLDMSNNYIQDIPFGALRGHATLEQLHLNNNKINMIDREALVAMPSLRELRLKNNSLSNLLDAPFWNLPALKGLDLSQNYYRRIEPRLLANLPSLRRVDVSENLITVVDPATFLDTPALEHVNISHNSIPALHPATFRTLVNLYELDVGYNKLIEFVPGLPRGIEYLHMPRNQIISLPLVPSPDLDLPMLRMLDISLNGIERIPPGTMRSLPSLRRLYAGNNALQQLEDGSLDGISRLEILDLMENRLVKMHPNVFRQMTELRELNLQGNHLEVLRAELLQNARNLRKLDVSHNYITEMTPGTLDHARELRFMDASYNMLTELPPTLAGLKHLKVLNLTNNRVRDIKPEILNSLSSISELRFTKNMINELQRGAFEDLPNLKMLYLDNNDLEVVDSNAIRALPSLTILKLDKNKLRDIPDGTFSDLPVLEMAELQENRLKNLASNAFYRVPQIMFLNLSYNQLQALDEAGLKNLRSLEVLDLSNNRLTKVANGALRTMDWLVELKMDNNELCGLRGVSFNDMPRLRVLSMKNNKITTIPETAVQNLRTNIAILDIDGNPLVCACSMLWLRAWLQETGSVGPRCSDGSLLREMRLSRQECAQRSEEGTMTDPAAPGCEAELLSVPSYSTSQVFSHWQDLKEHTTSKPYGLAPSPEESEYFYDEYIDYPFNDTIEQNNTLTENSDNDIKETTTVAGQKSSHYISGDTPVIYAATNKNKNQQQQNQQERPKESAVTPGGSGFTFFGVPLPSINLNKLWPAGKSERTAPAERKTDARNREASGRGNMFLPNHPEIQTGGFYPILPGSGGFKPMIPNYGMEDTDYEKVATPNTTRVPVSLLTDVTEDLLARRGPIKSYNNSSTVLPTTSTVSGILHQEIIIKPTTELITPSNTINTTESSNFFSTTTSSPISKFPNFDNTIVNFTSTEATLETVVGENFNDLFQDVIENVRIPFGTTEIPSTTDAEELNVINMPNNNNTNYESTTEIVNLTITTSTTEVPKLTHHFYDVPLKSVPAIPNNNNTPTPLSALLVPGGQQPPFRPSLGRSTITKVQSPHTSSNNTTEPKTKKKIFSNTDNISTSQIPPHDRSMSWYFMNYNKTNLQPYVDPAINEFVDSTACKVNASYCFLVAIFLFNFNYVL